MKPISRRRMLRSTGVGISLPMLESMAPVFAMESPSAPRRLVTICTTLGLYPASFWPSQAGSEYQATEYLQLLQDHRQDFTVLGGLQHEDQVGRQPHDSEMTWLTSARYPGMGGFRNSISVDQLAAKCFGAQTRYSSVTLGTGGHQSQSYTEGGVMIPAETSPATLFARMFLQGRPDEVAYQKRRLQEGRSVLDELKAETSQLKRRISRADNHLLNDYFDSVRTAEQNIANLQAWMDKPKPKIEREEMTDVFDPADLVGRLNLLCELSSLILQTDSSRVVSIVVHSTTETPRVKGVSGQHHSLSHHGKDKSKIAQLRLIEMAIVKCFGQFLATLKQKQEGDIRLLDSTSVLFGSNLGNANAHHTRNLPVIVAGGGYSHGRFVDHETPVALSNLFVTLLNGLGMQVESFGQSTGVLAWS